MTLLVLAGAGCGENAVAPLPKRSDLLAAVVPAVGAQISDSGTIPIARVAEAAGGLPVIPEARARELARAVGRHILPVNGADLVAQHGGPIDWSRLEPCGRAYLAESAFRELPPNLPLYLRNFYGSWWLVALCSSSVPQVSVAVAAHADYLRVVDERRITFVAGGGGEFRTEGIPRQWAGPLPIGPEDAVVMMAREAGARVAAPPRLVAPNPRRDVPQTARWLVTVEQDVRVTGRESGTTRARRSLMLGAVSDDDPRAGSPFIRSTPAVLDARDGPRSVREAWPGGEAELHLRPDVGLELESVQIVRRDP